LNSGKDWGCDGFLDEGAVQVVAGSNWRRIHLLLLYEVISNRRPRSV
jgi:hypothetical protein